MNTKKMLSFVMAFVMALSTLIGFTPQEVKATVGIPTTLGNKPLTVLGTYLTFFNYKGAGMGTLETGYKENGQNVYAYCMNPTKPGIGDNGARYSVSTSILANEKIAIAIENGYPNRTVAEMGLSSVAEAYAVTKMGVWASVSPEHADNNNYGAIAGNEDAYNALMKMLDLVNGVRADGVKAPNLTAQFESEVKSDNDSKTVQTYKVKDNGVPYSGTYTVKLPSDTGSANVVLGGITGDTFTLTITGIPPDYSKNFDFQVLAGGGKKVVVYDGEPVGVTNRQAYALAYMTDNIGTGSAKYMRNSEPTPEPAEAGLVIRKLAKGTNRPLAGASFKMIKLDGADAGHIGVYTTDASGSVVFNDLTPGAYEITEVVAPKGYVLDVTNMKNVTINAGNQVQQDVVFVNDEVPKLKLLKTNTKGEPLAGVVFEISLDGGSEKYTGITDFNGEIIFGKNVELKEGSYTVEELP